MKWERIQWGNAMRCPDGVGSAGGLVAGTAAHGAAPLGRRYVLAFGLLLASAICSAATEPYYFFVFSNPDSP